MTRFHDHQADFNKEGYWSDVTPQMSKNQLGLWLILVATALLALMWMSTYFGPVPELTGEEARIENEL